METRTGDILLIHRNQEPVAYARVEEILADVKPGWWQIRLLVLHPPAQEVTWILREEYIDGGDFTMGGEPMRLECLAPPQPSEPPSEEPKPEPEDTAPDDKGGGKVVSLARRRNKS
ncbi:MAG: hypothetical protein KQI62_16300 [Deltaproteobacteria bacterium]|nr:hypothetical protein [Deltaproteobacteria bacterium]